MTKGRCIGLIGGLGVAAAVHYYQNLAHAHDARGRTLDLAMVHAETSRVFEYIQAEDPRGLAEYLNGFLRRLKAAGAELGVVPAVTPLYCVRELVATSPLPLISMVDAVAAELAARSAQRVAVFGTRYVIESGFYGLLDNVVVVRPRADEIDLIHAIYSELLRDRRGSDGQNHQLTSLAHTLMDRDKVDTILLAGTDLSLIFNETNTAFPHIDCAAAHLTAIVSASLDEGA